MKLRELLNQATNELRLHKCTTPELDARLLLQHAAKLTIEAIYLQPELELSQIIIAQFKQALTRRVQHEPIAKIIGKKSFWKDDFIVNNYVLDPRPDSEVIIVEALKLITPLVNTPAKAELRFLDLGTGSGCLILSLLQEFPSATGIAVDISVDALKIAEQNAVSLSLQDRVTFIQQNWGDNLTEKFDLIVSNPPYIPAQDIAKLDQTVRLYDPISALDGGVDGLDPYRYLATQLKKLLKPDAYAILEFGYGQAESIKMIFEQHNYGCHRILKDLSGIERAIVITGILDEAQGRHPCSLSSFAAKTSESPDLIS